MEILDKYDIRPTKNFGQNFIIDPNVVVKIAKGNADKSLTTLEIGPGIGSLTEQLCIYSKKVYSYEIDKKLIPILEQELKDVNNLTLINRDFLKVDLKKEPYVDDQIVVIANLPYYITTPILFKLFESPLKIKGIHVMIQKEVGQRLLAKTGSKDYAALSLIVQYLYDVSKFMDVSKQVFYPKPNVDSIVVSLRPKQTDPNIDQQRLFDLIKSGFKYRRKTLYNNLKELGSDQLLAVLEKHGYSQKRAEELSLEDYLLIYHETESIR